MASIALTGILRNSLGEIDVGAVVTFTHLTTTGETIATTRTDLIIPPNGAYSINIEYGMVRVDYTTEYTERYVAIVIVNGDTVATSIPELLNAAVPVTDPVILEMQGILADAQAAATTSEAFADQLTTLDLIANAATFAPSTVIMTKGFTTSGDGGNGAWKQNGATGQTASQSPAQLGDWLLNDANGVQWGLIVVDSVNPEMLGADASGATDSYLHLHATHEGANLNNKPVFGTGTYLVNATDSIKVKTHVDYSLATFVIPDTVNILELIKIQETSSIVITPAATNFNKGVTVLSDVAAYPHSLIAINSNDTFVLRNGTDPVVKKDVVYHSESGHISHPLYFDMSTIDQVIIKKSEAFTLIFKAPAIEYAECTLTYFIRSGRNQVTVFGGGVTNSTVGSTPPIVVYFGPTACMDNTLDGRSGDALSGWGSGQSAYDFSGSSLLRPKVRNLVSPWTWGSVDGNVYRDLLVENSTVSRAGCHSMLFSGTFRNLTLTEKSVQVTGSGLLKLENVHKTVSTSASGAVNMLVDLREDYGGEWDGDIVIEDFSINYSDVALAEQDGTVVRLPFRGDTDYGKEIIYPKVYINRGKITMSSNAATADTYHIVEFFRYNQDQLYTRVMPKQITIKNVEVIIPPSSAVTVINPVRIAKIDSTNVSGNINVLYENSGYNFSTASLPIPQGGRSLRVEATVAEMASASYSIAYTIRDCKVDAIFRAPASWSMSCQYCEVYNFDNFFNAIDGLAYTEARNSNLWSGRYSGTAPKGFYSCRLKVDGTTDTAALSSGTVRLSEGVIDSGFVLTGFTNTQFVNGFYDETYYEPL